MIVKLKEYHYLVALVVIVKLLLKLRIKSQLKRLKIQLVNETKVAKVETEVKEVESKSDIWTQEYHYL